MATTKRPLSTISYNSKEFLTALLEQWERNGVIDWWCIILHKAEDGEKDHWHVYFEPSKPVDTAHLEHLSKEKDPKHDKPLKMVQFKQSKLSDWIMYTLHDTAYLLKKGQTREYHYKEEDYITSCTDRLELEIKDAKEAQVIGLEARIIEAVDCGMTWQTILRSGLVPMRYITGARLMYSALTGQENLK